MKKEVKNLIPKYFAKELDEEERQAFEKKLSGDPDFIRQFNLFKQSKKVVDQTYDDGSKAALISEWKTDLGNYKRQKQYKKWLVVSLGGILLVLSGIYLYSDIDNKSRDNNTPIALSQQAWLDSPPLYYDNDEVRSDEDQDADSYQLTITNSFKQYKEKKYKPAIETLSSFTSGTPYFEDALLIRGLCHYKLEEKAQALTLMEQIINLPNSTKKGNALWYSALIHLENDQITEAKTNLNLIIEQGFSTAAQAKALLKKINILQEEEYPKGDNLKH